MVRPKPASTPAPLTDQPPDHPQQTQNHKPPRNQNAHPITTKTTQKTLNPTQTPLHPPPPTPQTHHPHPKNMRIIDFSRAALIRILLLLTIGAITIANVTHKQQETRRIHDPIYTQHTPTTHPA
ncbi:hypothetical protein [Deinococcus pimensis]|uniref:hypothetical protein n=1 Tax=Deinococcus pimensis TaxID=309888 RepID=UPI00146FA640|nr:hypothetical protein [Deinococcus pimensis]